MKKINHIQHYPFKSPVSEVNIQTSKGFEAASLVPGTCRLLVVVASATLFTCFTLRLLQGGDFNVHLQGLFSGLNETHKKSPTQRMQQAAAGSLTPSLLPATLWPWGAGELEKLRGSYALISDISEGQ